MSRIHLDVPVTYAKYPAMPCCAPLGLPVVPLEYIRNRGPSDGRGTGSTVLPLYSLSRSFTKKSRPATIGVLAEYFPGYRCHTSTLSTCCPSSVAVRTAMSALAL